MIYDKDIKINATDIELKYDIIDSHLHFLDFTQDSDGLPKLTEAMDLSGVSEAIVFGMPLVKKWDCFMIGSDKVGHWENYPAEITKYYTLIDRLTPETAFKLCKGNALSLLKQW